MSYEASYMRNNYTEEAWLFLNHLSVIIGVNAIEEIASIGESRNNRYRLNKIVDFNTFSYIIISSRDACRSLRPEYNERVCLTSAGDGALTHRISSTCKGPAVWWALSHTKGF